MPSPRVSVHLLQLHILAPSRPLLDVIHTLFLAFLYTICLQRCFPAHVVQGDLHFHRPKYRRIISATFGSINSLSIFHSFNLLSTTFQRFSPAPDFTCNSVPVRILRCSTVCSIQQTVQQTFIPGNYLM